MKKNIYNICLLDSGCRVGLQMGKFWQISTGLRPLIDVRNYFLLSIFVIPPPIVFKLGMRVDIVKECSGIANG